MKKILIVLTNQKKIGKNRKETGFHFSEFSHAYGFFRNHNYEVIVASLLGGECPITSPHPEDKVNAEFYANSEKMNLVKETVKLDMLLSEKFDGVYFAGGHGTMVDFPNNSTIQAVIHKAISHGGVVGAVCHGPAAFVGVKNSRGKYLVDGKRVNSFTNEEEKKTPYYGDLPFYLESRLIDEGCKFESSPPREGHVAVDVPIVSGQNPESVEYVVAAMHSLLQK